MLDVYYPSLSALVKACREARAFLRSNHPMATWDKPSSYNIRHILPDFEEEIVFSNGTPQVVYVRHI